MSAIVLVILAGVAFTLGYRLYSRLIAAKVFRLDAGFRTPAHELEDGIDFVPTNRFVLWGHHFTSVAGAAPIVGPAIAVIWGWLPAFLWIVFGTVFMAGVHDAGALWASVRNRARSVGALSEDLIGARARSVFMIVIFFLLLMVNAVFAIVIANLFVSVPSSVLSAWGVIGVAVGIGFLIFKRGTALFWPSVVGVGILYGLVFAGQYVPIELPDRVAGLNAPALWVVLLFAYAGVASALPVWLLLQPRDYINGLQLFIALGIVFLAVFLSNPQIVAPAINTATPPGTPPLIPLLFVTIACGAISGFHGLVSSGTTSKQLDKETDVRLVGFLGATGEGLLAIASLIACTAGFATRSDWQAFYGAFTAGGVDAFVQGGARIVNAGLGLPLGFSETLLAVMAVLVRRHDNGYGCAPAALHHPGVGPHLPPTRTHPSGPSHAARRGELHGVGLRRRRRHGRRWHDHLAALWHHESIAGEPHLAGRQRVPAETRQAGNLHAGPDEFRPHHGHPGTGLPARRVLECR